MKRYFRASLDSDTSRADSSAPIRFTVATETEAARDGLILRMSGARLEAYQANPVLMWGHDYLSLPIGSTEVAIEGSRLVAEMSFDQDDSFAKEVERKVRARIVNAASIGWRTLKQVADVVEEWELLDVSLVAVPGDPTALALDRNLVGARGYRAREELDELAKLGLVRAIGHALDRAITSEAKRAQADAMSRFVYDDGPVFHPVTWAKELGPKRALPESVFPIPVPRGEFERDQDST